MIQLSQIQGVKNGPAMLHGASGATRKGESLGKWRNLFLNQISGQLRGGKWHGEATYTTQVQIQMCSLSKLSLKGCGLWKPKLNTKFQRRSGIVWICCWVVMSSWYVLLPGTTNTKLNLNVHSYKVKFEWCWVCDIFCCPGGWGEEGDVGQRTESLIFTKREFQSNVEIVGKTLHVAIKDNFLTTTYI